MLDFFVLFGKRSEIVVSICENTLEFGKSVSFSFFKHF